MVAMFRYAHHVSSIKDLYSCILSEHVITYLITFVNLTTVYRDKIGMCLYDVNIQCCFFGHPQMIVS